MPFYEALKFLLNTASSKIARKTWYNNDNGYKYIYKDFRKNKLIITGVFSASNGKEGIVTYNPSNDDMVADDWYIVRD